ncbi:MAG: transposase [Cocleimonas sp.]|nr:transposase [Cocleimonas sp.]
MGRYTQEFKSEAIALATKSYRTHQEIALDLGINPSTFRNWMSEAMMTDNSKSNKTTKKSQADLEKELLAMKKELAFRQEEIEILKKAAAYFAKNQK